jgi:hypothetical protein
MDLSFYGAELGFGIHFSGRVHSSLGEFEIRNEPNSVIPAWSVVDSDPIGYKTFKF